MDSIPKILEDLRLPTSAAQLNNLPPDCSIYECTNGVSRVKRTSPGVVIKYRGLRTFSEEAIAMEFVRKKTSIPIPRLLHCPLAPNDWYICMEEVRGTSLDKTIETMTTPALDHIASQLREFLAQLRSMTAPQLGSVTGGPYRNGYFPRQVAPDHPLRDAAQFIDEYRKILLLFSGEEWTDELLSAFPRDAEVVLSHGDLLPRNIMVDGSTITAILDWELAGFYPDYLEYCRMNCEHFMTPNWQYVVHSVFPGDPRDTLIAAFYRMTSAIWWTL